MARNYMYSRSGYRVSPASPPKGSDWLDQNPQSELLDEWLASDGYRLVAHDPSLDELVRKLHQQQIPLPEVTIRYNPRNQV